MMAISATTMEIVGHSLCMPVALLINFALFQYLVTMYYKRRREIRGALLLICAFLGFITLVPFSYPDGVAVGHLNDVSETCSVLTFLIQITIIGRDINKKVKITMLKYLTYASELLILFGLLVVLINMIEVCFPRADLSMLGGLDNVFEVLSLAFIFVFRFLILVMSRGVRHILENKKLEMSMYLLFITHEYPFLALESHSDVSWERVQALWHRFTLALCIGLTIRDKYRKTSSTPSKVNTTHASRGPEMETSSATPERKAFRTAAVAAAKVSSFHFMVRPTSVSVMPAPGKRL